MVDLVPTAVQNENQEISYTFQVHKKEGMPAESQKVYFNKLYIF